MTSSLSWKRSLLSISALLLFAYFVSSTPFFSNNHHQKEQQQEPRQRPQFPKTPSKMSIHPSNDLDITLSPSTSSPTNNNNNNNKIHLQKQPTSPSKYNLPLHVTITNTADHPISFLKWNSPFDPKAPLLGVFHISSTTTAQDVPLTTIKFSRKLPPPIEDVVEIPAGATVEREVEVSGVSLESDGGGYMVRAEGRWQGVWTGGVDEVVAEGRLDALQADGKVGEFRSNEVEVGFFG